MKCFLLVGLLFFVACDSSLDPKDKNQISLVGTWANATPFLVDRGDPAYDTLTFVDQSKFTRITVVHNGCPYPGDREPTSCDGWFAALYQDSGQYVLSGDSIVLAGVHDTATVLLIDNSISENELVLSFNGLNAISYVKQIE